MGPTIDELFSMISEIAKRMFFHDSYTFWLDPTCIATIDKVNLEVKDNGKNYLRLENFDSIDQTILVTHWNQDTCLELEVK